MTMLDAESFQVAIQCNGPWPMFWSPCPQLMGHEGRWHLSHSNLISFYPLIPLELKQIIFFYIWNCIWRCTVNISVSACSNILLKLYNALILKYSCHVYYGCIVTSNWNIPDVLMRISCSETFGILTRIFKALKTYPASFYEWWGPMWKLCTLCIFWQSLIYIRDICFSFSFYLSLCAFLTGLKRSGLSWKEMMTPIRI